MSGWNPKANELFLQAIQKQSFEQRAAYLDVQCAGDAGLRAEVESLLAASAGAATFLEQGAVSAGHEPRRGHAPERIASTVDLSSMREQPGAVVGRYKLRELIGEGGMGTVWIAEQSQPVRRKVALKLIKPGMDTREVLSRFEVERQALALMDHPNIAKVYDGGVTDSGRPFFVMEYVKGIPITQYCDQAKLIVKDRLRLFVHVCQAVQHAHQKGIIHRDLKPSNILICLYDGQPVPKIIDFGLAKAMHQPLTDHTLYTAHGLMVGTPLYMSPEQAEFNNLDVDTRTDIYSLGVVLYELLTGTTPLERQQFKEAAFEEILRLIKEEDPQKPSTKISGSGALATIAAQRGLDPAQLSRVVKGDLDWIAMKALEKDRSRRYESASGLARDVQRYLDDEPVEACPPSLGYKLRKLARRNKRAIATATVVAVILLAALTAVAGSVGWAVRDRQNRQAGVERRIEAALDEFADAVRRGQPDDARAALKQADALQAGIPLSTALDERLRASRVDLEMYDLLGEIQLDRTLDPADDAARNATAAAYRRAFVEYELPLDELRPTEAAQRIRGSLLKEHLLAALDDWALALPSAEEPADKIHKPGRDELLTIANSADDDPWRKQVRKAMHSRDAALLKRLAEESQWEQQAPLTVVLLATTLGQLGELDVAHPLLIKLAERDDRSFCVNQALGFVLMEQGSYESLPHFQFCRNRRPGNWSTRAALGWAYWWVDEPAAAERELREAIALRPEYSKAHFHLGTMLQEHKAREEEAALEYQRAMRFDPNDEEPCLALADLWFRHGKAAEAEKHFRTVVQATPSGTAYLCLGDALTRLDKSSEAKKAYDQAVQLDSSLGPTIKDHQASAAIPPELKTGTIEHYLSHYMQAVRSNPVDHASAVRAAVLHLYLGNQSQYEALCGKMLERFGDSNVASAAHRTSFACLLASPPVGDLQVLERLAERATANGGDGQHPKLLYGRGRGLAAYRAGRWDEAIKWCAESRFAGQELVVSDSVPLQDMLIEAMAYYQLGKEADASRLYEATARLSKKHFPNAPAALGDDWLDWLLYEILRREAAQLMGIQSPGETIGPSSAAPMALAQASLDEGRWDEAGTHLAAVVESQPDDHLLAMQTAVLQCYRNDRAAYDRVCQAMLLRYGNTEDPVEADRTAKACLLANPPAGELSRLIPLADTAVSYPEHGYYRYFVFARALAAYRAGEFESALAWCRQGEQRVGDPKQVPYLVSHYRLVQAMSQQQLQKQEEAAKLLAEAEAIMSSAFPEAPAKLGVHWADWLLFEVLRREATELIGVKAENNLSRPKPEESEKSASM